MAVRKRAKRLSHGRPPPSRPKERMTSDRSRTVIRTHHRLQKEHAAALKRGDTKAAEELSLAIENNGGIKMYQAASKQGQAKDRGGDSSKFLVEWLHAHVLSFVPQGHHRTEAVPLKCLEIGALSTTNEISSVPNLIAMTRIDLNSQGQGITKQDFMERPLPTSEDDYFDIISLSLVLNYVPDAAGRGDMLKRLTKFLRLPTTQNLGAAPMLPVLFLVLPLPCVENSRYIDENVLLQIMTTLGFTVRQHKRSSKLCYYIFTWCGLVEFVKKAKKKINDGPGLNNFAIVVE